METRAWNSVSQRTSMCVEQAVFQDIRPVEQAVLQNIRPVEQGVLKNL